MFGDRNNQGICRKTMNKVLNFIKDNDSRYYELSLSMLEIYNGDIIDLLNKEKKNLKIRGTDI